MVTVRLGLPVGFLLIRRFTFGRRGWSAEYRFTKKGGCRDRVGNRIMNQEHVKIVKSGPSVVRKWREENPNVQLDLSRANLENNILQGVDLTRANLSGCNLRNAILTSAILDEARLDRAFLKHARLRGVSFVRASFVDAILSDADLSEADLQEAILTGVECWGIKFARTNCTEMTVGWTSFGNVDFSTAIGLSSVRHQGPSTIGIDSVYASAGHVDVNFLRGCGVPETLIQSIPKLVGAKVDTQFYSCFISYSHDDRMFARRLHDQLQSRGIRCWLDEHEMLPGDDIYQEVDHGIRQWDKVLLCASQASLSSWWVGREVETTIEKEQQLFKDRGKQVLSLIPLNLDGSLFDWDGSHAATLRKRLAADFTGWESDNRKFEEQFERVVNALRADEAARPEPPESKL